MQDNRQSRAQPADSEEDDNPRAKILYLRYNVLTSASAVGLSSPSSARQCDLGSVTGGWLLLAEAIASSAVGICHRIRSDGRAGGRKRF